MAHTVGLTFDPDRHPRAPMIVHCVTCAHEWAPVFAPIDVSKMSRILSAARCPDCGGSEIFVGSLPRATVVGDIESWLVNGDCGTSSLTIFSVLGDPESRARGLALARFAGPLGDPPSDPSDFGRCQRLLAIVPAWRRELPRVVTLYPQWRPLVEAWDELTALYLEELPTGKCQKLYDRMKALLGEK